MDDAVRKQLAAIAAKNIPGLKGRKDLNKHFTDAADFFETSVWCLEAALLAAFELGRRAGAAGVQPLRELKGVKL